MVQADTLNPLTVAPSSCMSPLSCAPNTVVTITISATLNAGSQEGIGLVVFTPTGAAYVLNINAKFDNHISSTSKSFTCSVPFGGAGTMSGNSCGGSNSGVWTLASGLTISNEEADNCNAGVGIVSTGEGSTSQGGTYTVIGCFIDLSYVTAQFGITSPTSGVPEFPFGLVVLFALLVPALMVLRKRTVSLRSPIS